MNPSQKDKMVSLLERAGAKSVSVEVYRDTQGTKWGNKKADYSLRVLYEVDGRDRELVVYTQEQARELAAVLRGLTA